MYLFLHTYKDVCAEVPWAFFISPFCQFLIFVSFQYLESINLKGEEIEIY